jgi:CRP-like cAMP-binding protein
MFAFATSERFARLSRKERDRLEALSKLDEFGESQVILVAGRHSDSIYLIASGAVDVRVKTRAGDLTIAQLGPGDLFGELERFAEMPEGVRHVARTRTVVRAIARNPLRHEVLVHRDLASGLLAVYGRSISEKLRSANEVALTLTPRSIPARRPMGSTGGARLSGNEAAWLALLGEELKTASGAVALTPEILSRIESHAFDKALRVNFTVAFKILASLCALLGRTYRETILGIIEDARS